MNEIKHINTDQVFLAITALEDFWDMSGPVVFLSNACTRYSRKHIWEGLSHVILTNPLQERERYYKDYAYVQGFYEQMLLEVGQALNRLHGVSYSPRYWRITLGFWLLHYVHVLYERYIGLKDALEKYPELATFVLSEEDFVVPGDTWDFAALSKEDPYNLQLYSRIFDVLGKSFPVKRHAYTVPLRNALPGMGIVNKFFKWFGKSFMRDVPVVMRQVLLPTVKEKLRLLLACRGRLWLDMGQEELLPSFDVELSSRKGLQEIKTDGSEFGEVFLRTYVHEIPKVFVEGFDYVRERASECYVYRPRAIVTATSFAWEEMFKFWAAGKSEDGVVLTGVQHGGNYGVDFIHPQEKQEVEMSDRFYSWGWGESGNAKIRRLPAAKYIGVQHVGTDRNKEGILLTATCFPRFFYRYHGFRNYDIENYLSAQRAFIGALSSEVKRNIRIRNFIYDYGWDIRDRWQEYDPTVILETWGQTFLQSLSDCRLHVTDHLSSTFADSLAVGKPTILFWDQELIKVREEARPCFDELRRMGILYDSPDAAARAVARVYADVETWWNDPQRQKVLREFCRCFVRTSPFAVEEWAKEIRELACGPVEGKRRI